MAAARARFDDAVRPVRRELRLHCYRMTGQWTESEDLLQETLLRAWRGWSGFRAEASTRTWLYRIATNVCREHLRGRARAGGSLARWPVPVPDSALIAAGRSGGDDDPADLAVRRETIEIAFLAALQVLPVQQRAALILRDVLGMHAVDAAEAMGVTVPALKSALQRARARLREALPPDRSSWDADRSPTDQERAIARCYVTAVQRRDAAAMAALLHQDLRVTYLPGDLRVHGREAFLDGTRRHAPQGTWRYRLTGVNAQPAIAVYLRPPGAPRFALLSLAVLRIAGQAIAEIVDFSDPAVLQGLGMPATLSASG